MKGLLRLHIKRTSALKNLAEILILGKRAKQANLGLHSDFVYQETKLLERTK